MPITKSPPHLASRLRVAVARLARRLRQEGSSDDSTPSQLTALSTLYHEGPMTIGALAAAERVKPPSMTRVVAALEERGLVTREHSPKDARVVFVQATQAGRRSHEEYRKRRDAWLAQQLNKLSAEDRDVLIKATEILDRMADRDTGP
ncbi:MAG: MarR family transcriptional regulator [Actinomycetota bacterium]